VNHSGELPCIGPDCSLDSSVAASGVQPLGGSNRKRRHPAGLLSQIAEHLSLEDSREPIELELYLADYQPARIGGLNNEFVHAPRLDNLFNAYAGICGLVESLDSLPNESCLRIVCLYDHEEVGSTSAQGANSAHTLNILRRMAHVLAMDKHLIAIDSDEIVTSVTHFEESLSKSFLLSADQSHAVHPSYGDRHEVNHKPQLHGGLVLKCNSSQRYATNALTAAVVRQVASLAKVPVQEFTPRQDMHCGSTIGPLLASQLGVPTADVGFAQLAMHSCRELCCTTSCGQAVQFYSTFFEHMPKIWPPN
ncbi:aspartyl aminopeptidase, partial [Paragonimus westermani]